MRKTFLPLIVISMLFLQCEKDSSSFSASNSAVQPTGLGGSLARFAISGNYLYSVDEQQLKVFDISNPADPTLKQTVNIGFAIETIYPFKDKLFIGSTSQVYIYSITDPAKPERLGTAVSPQVLRRCDPVVAKDTVAFATLRTNGACGGTQSILAVYDIKDVTKPVQKATYPVSEPYGLGYSNDVLYVCDKQNGLMIMDISKPFQPTLIKSIHDGSYIDVIPYQNTLICWVATGIILYDITNNRNPLLLAKII
ncbi:MAG: hypothetical protein H0X70_11550 [Segetibacter sp.]|nr:hypothetical protein [Segetibacter sp.]